MNNKSNIPHTMPAIKAQYRHLLSLLLLTLLCHPLPAQGVAEAWLDKAVTMLQHKGVEIHFRISEDGIRIGGKLLMEGNKYMFDTDEMKVWFDGTTQYTLQTEGDYSELYISHPTIEDQQSINPYLLLKHCTHNYTPSDGGEKNEDGHLVHKVILTAKDSQHDLTTIDVYIRATGELAALRLNFRDERIYKTEVRSMRNGLTFPNTTFTYQEKAYPATEVIDMR